MKKLFLFLIMSFNVGASFAQEAVDLGEPPQLGIGESLMPLLIIFAIFYFLILRPQSKKMKEHVKMVKSLHKGDEVITAGGVIGKVVKVYEKEDRLEIEIAPEIKITVVQSTITNVSEKGKASEKAEKDAEGDTKKDLGKSKTKPKTKKK